mmetsp:Transcript_29473/g.49522  ORF Transcript_29473/g.49522 Transcript_29473/m.49522 type:complete len:304 (+) Transcript_29473:79-990(+)
MTAVFGLVFRSSVSHVVMTPLKALTSRVYVSARPAPSLWASSSVVGLRAFRTACGEISTIGMSEPKGMLGAARKRNPFARVGSLGRSMVAAAGQDRQILVQHILVGLDKEAELDGFAAIIAEGADFGEMAEANSNCPSGKKGGLIGWISPGKTEPEFEATAFSLEVGDVAKCQTRRGHHLLTVVDERPLITIKQMAPQQLQEILAADGAAEQHQFVDVREPFERDIASLPNFELYPLSTFNEWAPMVTQKLDVTKSTLVLCHHGVRSMQAANFLVSQGFEDVSNITGGIDRYTLECDKTVPQY